MSKFHELDRNMPIMVVNNFSTMRRIIKNCLKQLGFENVTEAENAEGAWNQIEQQEFQLIIADWGTPQTMTLELVRAVRDLGKYRKIPFLIVTSAGQRESVLEAAKAGVSDYIVKPFTADMLQNKLEAIFKSA